jgi:hypothetical protein
MARVKRAQKRAHTLVRGRRFFIAAIFAFVVIGAIGAAAGLAGPGGGTTTVAGDASCGYSGTTQFTESTVMRWAQTTGTTKDNLTFDAYANDENSTLLGVNTATQNTSSPQQVSNASGGDSTQHDGIALTGSEQPRPYYPALYITPLPSGPGSWTKPGDAIPAAAGDWQQGGSPVNNPGGHPYVDNVFGTWVVGTQTTNPGPAPGNVGSLGSTLSTAANITSLPVGGTGLTKAVSVNDVINLSASGKNQNWTVTVAAGVNATSVSVKSQKPNFAYPSGTTLNDTTAQTGNYARQASLPAKNDWNLGTFNASGQTGPNADPPVGQTFANMGDEGYGTEFRWNISGLHDYQGTALQAGAYYKVQIVEHDGDQNKGGDSGEFCTIIKIPGQTNPVTHPVVGGNPGANATISEPLGATINDSASVSPNPGFPNPTGNIVFKLYFIPNGDSTTPANACNAAHDTGFSQTVPLTVSGTAGTASTAETSPGYATGTHGLGTYVWDASYDPNGDPNYLAGSETCGTETDTMVDARIELGPHNATNSVGTAHTVTATLQTTTDGTTYTAVSGATVNFTISGSLSGTGPNTHLIYDGGGSSSCSTGTGGTCTTTINDNESEQITIHASATGFTVSGVQGSFGTFSTSTAGPSCTTDNGMDNGASTCDALKTYAIGRILISPEEASNVVGTDHVLTATLQYSTDNGTNWHNAGTGETISFSIDASSTVGAHFQSSGTGLASCPTTGGSCSVTLQDANPGTINVNASSTFGVSGITGTFTVSTVAPNGTCDTAASGTAGTGNCDAVKHFYDSRILLSPESASNVVGNTHTFTATVEKTDDGTTYSPVSGAHVIVTLDAGTHAFFVPVLPTPLSHPVCTTDANGQCTVTINDNHPETVTVHASSSFTVTDINGTFSTSTSAAGGGCSANAEGTNNGTCDAVKVYYAARILLTPETATNLVGNPHTFTATLQTTSDGSTWVTVPSTAGDGKTIDWTATGLNTPDSSSFVDGGTVNANTDTCSTTAGSCSQTITDSKPDTVDVHVSSTFTIAGIGTFNNIQTTPTSLSQCDASAGGASGGTCDAIKTYFSPSTTLHVSDTLEGLPPDATGNVTYEVYTNLAQCQATPDSSTDRILNENDPIVTTGVIPTSSVVDVPKGTTIWWKVTYSGNDGTFTTDCTTETASSS